MAEKKKMGWDFEEEEATSSAKSSIQKTIKTSEPSKPRKPKTPSKPKKKNGRPLDIEGEKVKVLISLEGRNWAKKIAVMEEITMTRYLTNLVLTDAKKKGYLKE